MTALTEYELMWRSLFLAMGLTLMIIGAECLIVDQAVFAKASSSEAGESQQVVEPPDWAPWTLLSAGAVICIYSFTVPRRVKG